MRIRHPWIAAIGMILAPVVAGAQGLVGELVVGGLSQPVAFVQHPTLPAVQLIVEQGGRVRVLQAGALAGDFLNLTTQVATGGEQGLLGLAFAPDFLTSRRVFVNFTNTSGHTVIARFLQPNDTTVAVDPSSRFDLKWPGGDRFIMQPFTNHNGGDLVFGADGYLYIPLGDGGDGNDPAHNAQTPSTLLGKILRIDVSVSASDDEGYDVPADNPFVGQVGVLAEIWAFGLRNPWRASMDAPARGGTGALILGDVGQVGYEEIDYEPAGAGGRNYGWRNREASHPHIETLPPAYLPLTDPIWEYPRADGHAVSGGHVYRGAALGAAFEGRYFFGDFSFSRVWSVALSIDPTTGDATASDLQEHSAALGAGASNPSAFGLDSNGELYVVNYGGTIHRIAPAQFVRNGAFDQGMQGNGAPTSWTAWALPTLNDILVGVVGDRLDFSRPAGSAQALVFQPTNVPMGPGRAFEATFDAANTGAERRRLSIVIHDRNFSDITACHFWLPPFSPLQTYRMESHTTRPWTNATVSFYAATVAGAGSYQIDNVSMAHAPSLPVTSTTCHDPLAPSSGGITTGQLLQNGAFSAGLSSWGLFGSITWQIAGGVFEFLRPAGPQAGVLLQQTFQSTAAGQRMLATFSLGNSSAVRQRVTILLQDLDFSDLHACTFWLPPGLPLSTFSMRTWASAPWTNTTISIYAATVGSAPSHEWVRIDDVSLVGVTDTTTGTECVEPGGSF